MARISSGLFNKWLTAYGSAWENGDPHKASELFSDQASYQETPFEDPMIGREAIHEYWRAGAESSQTEISFTYRILSVRRNEGIAHWQAKFNRVPSGNRVELDGVLVAEFDDVGLCADFKEWWHHRETAHEDSCS